MFIINWLVKLHQHIQNQKRLDTAIRELAVYGLELKLNHNKESLYIIDSKIRKGLTFVCHFDHKDIDLKKKFKPLSIPEIRNYIYFERQERQLKEK